MRNVVRAQEPKLFRSKADGWRKALLDRVATGEKVSSYYYDRYNQPNTKTIRKELENNLLKMYEGMCCYCEEATPRVQGEIEHLKPKKRFPINAYEWKNLHWVCRVCNRRKLEKYDEAKPILDPSDAESISNHIELEIEEDIGWVWLINKDNSARGDTTINHADLNREDLGRARMKIFLHTTKLLRHIKNASLASQRLAMDRLTLKRLYLGEFGFVTTVRDAFETASFKYEHL